jgi:Na+/melibiose symporter-like transporter
MSINNSILVPMVADISDSEVARTGRYVPGLIGAMFSFVDKLFTSLNNVVVGLLLIIIGFGQMYPTPETPVSPGLFWVGMICLCGLPALSWVVNIICMRFYPLDKKRMAQVQAEISTRKLDRTTHKLDRTTHAGPEGQEEHAERVEWEGRVEQEGQEEQVRREGRVEQEGHAGPKEGDA